MLQTKISEKFGQMCATNFHYLPYIYIVPINHTFLKFIFNFLKDHCQQHQMGLNMSAHSQTTSPSLWIFIPSKINLLMMLQNASRNSHAGNNSVT